MTKGNKSRIKKLLRVKKQKKQIADSIKDVVKDQIKDVTPGGRAAAFASKIVDDVIENPVKATAQAVHYGKHAKNGATVGFDYIKAPIKKAIIAYNTEEKVVQETNRRIQSQVDAKKKKHREKKALLDEQWKKDNPNPSWLDRRRKRKADRQWEDKNWVKENNYGRELFNKTKDEVIREQGYQNMADMTRKAQEQYMNEHNKERQQHQQKAAIDIVDSQIRNWMGVSPEATPEASLLNDYAGGTQFSKFIKNIKDINEDPNKSWRNVDLNSLSGAAAEVIGNLNKDQKGSTWSPLISAGIGAAKKFLGVTNPWLGIAMDVGGLLATTPAAREAAKWVGDKAISLGRTVIDKVRGKNLATMHREGVIPIVPKAEPIQQEQKPIDYSGINIPNLLPQESNAEYMMRMTGGMNVGPANANVVSYSGYRKPQYEKVDNRVMMAPPKLVKKKVRVKKKKSSRTT